MSGAELHKEATPSPVTGGVILRDRGTQIDGQTGDHAQSANLAQLLGGVGQTFKVDRYLLGAALGDLLKILGRIGGHKVET